MKMNQIVNIYEVNGLTDFLLKTFEDLLKVHGIDVNTIEGYSLLDDINRRVFDKFILNFYNAQGLESRAAINPIRICYAEEVEHLVKKNQKDDYFVPSGGYVKSIDRYGNTEIINRWSDDEYKDYEILESETRNYLRFEYESEGKKTWFHVIKDGEKWY